MGKFEGINPGQEYIAPKFEGKTELQQPESEKYQGDDSEQPPTRDLYEKTPEELEHLEEIRRRLKEKTKPPAPSEQPASINPTEVEVINGQQYHVEYVPKESIYPAFGYGGGNSVEVRQDLPPRVKRFVKAHELYHCQDKANWGGWLGKEIRANAISGLKDPIGLVATVWETITDIDRIKLYLDRIRKGY